ncbi:MAG: hypothetical protein GY769_22425 [bacterium]|nr:hypothetical protein [bacterium]
MCATEVVYFNHPKVVNGPATVDPGRIETLDPLTATRTVIVSNLDYPSGLALDPAGNLYFGNVTTGPIRVELRRRAPDGTITSLGTVVDTSAGFVSVGSWAFDLCVEAGVVYFNHPEVTNGGAVVEAGRIEKIDPVTAARTVVVPGLDNPSGLAFDGAGNLYFGNMTTGPVRVELRKRAPDGTVASLGMVVDTSAGFVTAGSWGFDVACLGSEVYFNHPRVTDGGVTVDAGRIEKIDPSTLVRTGVLGSLSDPSGLAFDSAGDLHFGEVTHGPVQIELEESSGGITSTQGIVVDTSAGFIAAGAWAFDVAVAAPPTETEPDDGPLEEPPDRSESGCRPGCLILLIAMGLALLLLLLLWLELI